MLSVCDLVKVTHSLEKSNKKDTFPPRTEPGKHTLKKLRPCAGGAGAQGDQDAEIYPDRTILQEDARTPVFTAAQSTAAKTWRHPRCPQTDEWIQTWCIYTAGYYPAIKQRERVPFAPAWMDLEILVPREVGQRKTNIIRYPLI